MAVNVLIQVVEANYEHDPVTVEKIEWRIRVQ